MFFALSLPFCIFAIALIVVTALLSEMLTLDS